MPLDILQDWVKTLRRSSGLLVPAAVLADWDQRFAGLPTGADITTRLDALPNSDAIRWVVHTWTGEVADHIEWYAQR